MSPSTEDIRKGALIRDRLLAVAAVIFAAAFGGFIALPLAALLIHVPVSAVGSMMQRSIVVDALRLSFETTLASAVLIVLGGTPLAALLARTFKGRDALASLATLPLVLPPVVAGLGLLLAFGRSGLLGRFLDLFGMHVPFSIAAVVLAQTFVAAPLYVIAARSAFERTDRDQLDAAATLRASPAYAFWRITLPAALPALCAGLAMAAARGLGEFGATITFAGNLPGVTQTMPLAAYVAAQSDMDAAVTISVVLACVAYGALLGSGALANLGRRTR
ncbi:MAG TPA: molybdate ABC transporter permease subunit [Candidatus Eremiobacteraceae bacterium]|nr:molybdate ABC transporter permease subunit [Candidatus Eremiobacteraceae bacterium]